MDMAKRAVNGPPASARTWRDLRTARGQGQFRRFGAGGNQA
jgi:hypothetical protein